MEDKEIRCQDCCGHFIFTAKQQKFYIERGWPDPIRCPRCRDHRRETRQKNQIDPKPVCCNGSRLRDRIKRAYRILLKG